MSIDSTSLLYLALKCFFFAREMMEKASWRGSLWPWTAGVAVYGG